MTIYACSHLGFSVCFLCKDCLSTVDQKVDIAYGHWDWYIQHLSLENGNKSSNTYKYPQRKGKVRIDTFEEIMSIRIDKENSKPGHIFSEI